MTNDATKANQSRTRTRRTALLAGPLVTVMCVPALGGPEGERVVAGRADFAREGSHTTIRAADNTIINYTGFDIASNESVRFVQPGADARVLNRVNSPDPTRINGSLSANGQVFIVNPAGVFFGNGAVVDVGRLYAAAGSISNEDFLAGRNRFMLEGEVINEGHIEGGGVALMGRRVANFGRIVAPEGFVTLAVGDQVLVGERGGHVFANVAGRGEGAGQGGIDLASLENGGEIHAADGQVRLAAGDLYALVVHETSEIRAEQVAIYGGRDSSVTVSGSIDVSDMRRGGTGGRVRVTGEEVGLFGADIDASGSRGGGEVLIGGDVQGGGEMPTASYSLIDGRTTIAADARDAGEGGKVVLWADKGAYFGGRITARGSDAASGGFVETSGKQTLRLAGGSVVAPGGTWLLDPTDVTIMDGTGDGDDVVDNGGGTDPNSFAGDPSGTIGTVLGGDTTPTMLFESELEGLAAGVDIVIEATNDITIENLLDNVLDLQTTGSVTFRADSDSSGGGDFVMNAGDTIRTQGASLNIFGDGATVGEVQTNGGAYSVDVGTGILQQIGDVNVASGSIIAGSVNIFADLNTTAGDMTITNSGTLNLLTPGASVSIAGALNQNGSGGVVLLRDITANSVSLSGALSVTQGNRTINSSTTADFAGIGTDGNSRLLTINAPGATTLSGVINDPLLSLETDAPGSTTVGGTIADIASLTINDDATLSADVTGTSIVLNEDVMTTGTRAVTTQGALSFGDADDDLLTLGGDLTVNANLAGAGGNALEFFNVDGGGFLLTANNAEGATSFNDVSGGLGLLDDVGITTDAGAGATTIDQPVTNGAALTFNDDVSLGADVDGASAAFNGLLSVTGGDRTVTSAGAADFAGIAADGSARLLTINAAGTTTLSGVINDANLSLTTDGPGTTAINAPIQDAAALTFNDDATLSASVTGDSFTAGGLVTVTGGDRTITSATSADFAGIAADGSARLLTVNADGTTTLGGVINDANLSLTTDSTGATAINAAIQDAAALTFNDDATLSASVTADSFAAGGLVTVTGGDRTITTTTTAEFMGIAADGSARLLTVNADGTTTLGGVISDANLSLSTDTDAPAGSTVIDAEIQNGATFTFNDDVALNADVSGAGVAFNEDVTTSGTRVVSSTGAIAFGDAMDDELTLGGDLTANADTGGGAAALDFRNITGGGFSLTANNAAGPTNFNPGSGATIEDLSITTDAGAGATTIDEEITNASTLAFNDDVNLNEDVAGDSIAFNEDVTTTGTRVVASQGALSFGDAADDVLTLGGELTATADLGGAAAAFDFFGIAGGGETLNANNALGMTSFNAAASGVDDASVVTDAGAGGTVIDSAFGDSDMGTPDTLTFNDDVTLNEDITGFVDIFFNENVTSSGTRIVSAKDELRFGDASDDLLTLGGMLTATADSDDNAGGVEVLSFFGVAGGANGLVTDSNMGETILNEDVVAGSLDATAVAISLGGDVDTSAAGGDQTYTGPMTLVGAARTLDAGTGGITVNDGLMAGAFGLTLIGDGIDLLGGADSVTGTGGLTIRPSDANTDLDIGTVPAPGSGLQFGQASFQAIGPDFGSVTFGLTGTGAHTIQAGDVGTTYESPTTFASPSGETVLVSDSTAANDGSFTFTSPVRVGEGLGVTLTTADQGISFPGEVFGTPGGASESLSLDAGTGAITLSDLVSGDGTTGDATGLADLTLVNGGTSSLQGVDITGALSTSNQVGGSGLAFNADVIAGSVSADAVAISLGGDVDTSAAGGDQTYTGPMTLVGAARTLDAGAGTLTFNGMVDLAGFDLELISGDLDFLGGAGSIKDTVGNGGLTLATDDPTRAIDVGDVASPQAMALGVDQTDLDALSSSGLGSVTIGNAGGAHANLQIDDATFGFDAFFQSPTGGMIRIVGPTTNALAGASTSFEAPAIELGATVTTSGGAATFAGPVSLIAGSSVATGGGDVIAESTIDGGFDLEIQAFQAGSGQVDVQDTIGASAALSSLDIEGLSVDLSGIGSVGTPGVTGLTDVRAAGNLRLGGGLYQAGEQRYAADAQIRLIESTEFFSNGSDMTFTTAGLGAGPNGVSFIGLVLESDSMMTARTGGGDLTVDRGIRNEAASTPEADLDFDADTGMISVFGRIGEEDTGNGTFEQVDQIVMRGGEITTVGARSRRSQAYQADQINISGVYETLEAGSDADLVFAPDGGSSTQVTLFGDATVRTAGATGDDAVFGDPGAGEPGDIDGGFGLTVSAGDGDAMVEGVIGSNAPLASLDVSGFDVSLSGIGVVTPDPAMAGVTGATDVVAQNSITLRGGGYNAAEQRYEAESEIALNEDTTFLSNGSGLTFAGDGFIRLPGTSLTANTGGGDASFGVEIVGDTGAESVTVLSGSGTASFDAIGGDATGADAGSPTVSAISITGDEIDFSTSVFGETISLEASTDGLPIVLGGANEVGGQLDLRVPELAQLEEGFSEITIGSDMGTNAITVIEATFRDPATIRSPGDGGSILVDGILRGADDATLTLRGPGAGTTLQGSILTDGNDVLIDDGVTVAGDSDINTDRRGEGFVGGGAIEITGPIDGPAGLELLARDEDDSARGDVTLGQDVGAAAALSSLDIGGDTVSLQNIGTDAMEGVTGRVSVRSFDDIIFNGSNFNAGEHLYDTGDEARITQDTLFQSPGGPIRFDDAIATGPSGDIDGFAGILLEGASDLTVMTNGGELAVSDVRQEGLDDESAAIVLDAGAGSVTAGIIGGTVGAGSQNQSPGTVTAIGDSITVGGVTTRNDQSYTGQTTLNGDLVSFESGSITIDGDTLLGGDTRLETAGAEGDDLTLMGLVDPESDDAPTLTIDLGSEGNLLIDGDAGGTFGLGAFTVSEAGESTVAGVRADGIAVMVEDAATFGGRLVDTGDSGIMIQSASGDQLNDVTIGDGVEVGSGGLSVTGDVFDFDGLFRTTDEGAITLDHLGNLTFGPNALFDLDGDFTQMTDAPVIFDAPVSGERIELVSLGNTVTLTGPVTLGADGFFRGFDVSFDGNVVPSEPGDSSLTVRGNGTLSFMGSVGTELLPFSSVTLRTGVDGSGVAELGGNVTTSGFQQFELSTTLMGGASEMEPQTLDAGGRIGFGDDVETNGFVDVIAGEDILVEGVAQLFGAHQMLRSETGTTFEGIVRLDGVTDVVSKRDVMFMSPIEGPANPQQGVAGQLNVLLDAARTQSEPSLLPAPALEASAQEPVVTLLSSVGETIALDALNINSNADTDTRMETGDAMSSEVPLTPTIVLGEAPGAGSEVPDFSINADSFEAGFFETIVANNNLTINATDRIAIPDMSVLGSLTLNSPVLELRARPEAPRVLFAPAGGLQGLTFNEESTDAGADVVVAGIQRMGDQDVVRSDEVLILNTAPDSGMAPDVTVVDPPFDVEGSPEFLFSAPEGEASLGGAAPEALEDLSVLRPFTGENAERGNFRVASVLMNDTLREGLDLRASGIGENPANTRALAVAASASLAEIQQGANPGTIGDEQLRQIGIVLRDMSREALIDSIVGFSLYQDLEQSRVLGEGATQALVTRNRLDFELVEEVVRRYDELFFDVDIDETGEPVRQERVPQMQASIEDALLAYFDQTGRNTIDPAGFNEFIAESGLDPARETRTILAQIRGLLDSVRSLGITPADYEVAKGKILSLINIQGMSLSTFEAIVDHRASAGQADGRTPQEGQPENGTEAPPAEGDGQSDAAG